MVKNRKFNGICNVYNISVNGKIEYKDSSTFEGEEYSKYGLECSHKDIHNCTKNNCLFWKEAQKVIRA